MVEGVLKGSSVGVVLDTSSRPVRTVTVPPLHYSLPSPVGFAWLLLARVLAYQVPLTPLVPVQAGRFT